MRFLRYGQELERDRFRYEVLYKGMTIRQVIEQKSNRLSHVIAETDKFRVK